MLLGLKTSFTCPSDGFFPLKDNGRYSTYLVCISGVAYTKVTLNYRGNTVLHRAVTTWVIARGKWRPPSAPYPLKKTFKNREKISWGAWEKNPLTPPPCDGLGATWREILKSIVHIFKLNREILDTLRHAQVQLSLIRRRRPAHSDNQSREKAIYRLVKQVVNIIS